jgi:adenylosuccinate synthase
MCSGAAMNTGSHHIWLSADSVIKPDQLMAEWLQTYKPFVHIHERAMISRPGDETRESEMLGHIASTMQGGCVASTDKMRRGADVADARIWRDHKEAGIELDRDRLVVEPAFVFWREFGLRCQEQPVLHEVSQGTGLSIDHGTHYPHCTYRNCTTASALDDLGVAPRMLRDVYMVIRTFPIRVGNLIEHGKQVGYSGDFPADSRELTWSELLKNAGTPEHLHPELAEHTTVTKRLRRIATPSWDWLAQSARINGPTALVVTFAEYLDWSIKEKRGGLSALQQHPKVMQFVNDCERVCGAPVVGISTGPDHLDMIWLDQPLGWGRA